MRDGREAASPAAAVLQQGLVNRLDHRPKADASLTPDAAMTLKQLMAKLGVTKYHINLQIASVNDSRAKTSP